MKKINFKINTEIKLPREFIVGMPSSGPADEYVKGLLEEYNVVCSVKDAQQCLKSTGGWTLDELQDHDVNLARLVWIACLDCQEQETNYFYMGA